MKNVENSAQYKSRVLYNLFNFIKTFNKYTTDSDKLLRLNFFHFMPED